MKSSIILLFLCQIFYVLSPIPNWDISAQSIVIDPSYNNNEIPLYDKTAYDIRVVLKKTIKKTNNVFSSENYLTVYQNGQTLGPKTVNFDHIDSHYTNKLGYDILICPKGKFQPYDFNNGRHIDPPPGFADKEGWDLRCFDHTTEYFYLFYLLNNGKNFYYKYQGDITEKSGYVYSYFYDYRLQNDYGKGDDYEYKFCILRFNEYENNNRKIIISPQGLKVNKGNGDVNKVDKGNGDNAFTNAKSYTQAYFKTNYHFYYFTYNSVTDFESGYSGNNIDFTNDDLYKSSVSNPGMVIKTDSPLSFVNNVEIEEMNLIPETQYIYYKLKDKDTNKKYYGFIDIEKNKVLYNIESEFTKFIPVSNHEMLAINSTSAYKICIIKSVSDGNTYCSETCSSGELILDADGNKCQTGCDSGKVKLMPDNYCIKKSECDKNIYELNSDETICGLCSYFNNGDNGAKYKFINTAGCLSTIPNNADFYNEKLNILKCKTNYHFNDEECIPDYCYESCATCSEISNEFNDQKCLSCKQGYTSDNNGNCILAPTTIIIPPTTVKIPPTTVTIPPTTINIPPTTVNIPHTTVNIPPTTIKIPPTTIMETPTTIAVSPTTINIPPTTVVEPQTTIKTPPTTFIILPTTVIIPLTTLITTIPEKIATAIPTTIPLPKPEKKCAEKCLECNAESNEHNLCVSCNEALGYKKVNYTLKLTKFLDCLKKEDPHLKKFYYNETLNEYRPCYKTCKKCLKSGNAEIQNCLECETNYMFRPGDNPHNNCVAYSEYYFINSYNQYKSLNTFVCPEEAKYMVTEKKYCIYDCKQDKEYKYLYSGQCIKSCPSHTKNISFICSENPNTGYLSTNVLYDDNLTSVDNYVKTFISEFRNNPKHATLYNNENYNILLYRNPNIINDLSLKMTKVDFKDCYDKVKQEYGINDDLVITVVDKKNVNNPTSYYSFFHPKTGEKLDAENICKDETIVVKENLNTILNENDTKYELQSSLTDQGINIFDVNDPFYTDLCFDYKNPKKRDIPLKDRIKNVFPNITLCNEGCQLDGLNLEDMTATCNCKFNDIPNNELIKENAVLDSMVGEIFDLINSSNIFVVKCYKNIFKHFKNTIGGILTSCIIALNLILTTMFFMKQFSKISEYIISITRKYLAYLSMPFKRGINYPPKRVSKIIETKNEKPKKNMKKRRTLNQGKKGSKNLLDKKNLDEVEEDIPKRKNKKKSKTHKIQGKYILNNNYYGEVTTDYLDENRIIEKFVEEYLETSPDEMEYDDAIKKDDRTFCEYFTENLKEKQIIANTFIAIDPIKSRAIKIILFNLNLILYFVINGLFISEDYISELYYINEEDENFFSFLPRSVERLIYTTLVSIIIGYITSFFFLEENKIKGIFKRDMENRMILKENINDLIKELKTRYISFIIVVFVISLLSLYYLLCFNYVYPKTQIEWIKSSIAIIIVIQILSVLKILLEAIIRFLSFACESEKLFQFGKIFS